jgi:hypothetical protein
MPAMQRTPFVLAGFVMLLGPAWALRLVAAPGPFAPDAAGMLGFGLTILAFVAGGGILLVRSRWAYRLAFVLVAASLLLSGFMDLEPAAAITFIATAVALVLLVGPWPAAWIRRRSPAEALSPAAVVTGLGLVALPALVGMAAPSGLAPAHWVLGAGGLLLGWGYARAHSPALRAVRLGLVPGGWWAAAASPLPGAVVLVAATAGIAAAAWTRSAERAVRPLVPARGTVANPFHDARHRKAAP